MKQSILMMAMALALGLGAQNASLGGLVLDENGEALPFATVGMQPGNHAVTADTDGRYRLDQLPAGRYTLRATSLGFSPLATTISLAEGEAKTLDIRLESTAAALEEVVVSATMKEVSKANSPVPVEVYNAQFFRANPTPSIFESLQNVNGVRPQLNCNVCNTGDIHINGLEGPYTMVLIDGMPIVSGLATVYGLTGIPQAMIERVEIVKGPASTLYGSEAVGGLINIITKKPGNAPRFSADVFSSDWGDVNADLGLKFGLGPRGQSLLGINYFNFQNRIDRNDDGFTDVTLQNRLSVFQKFTLDRPENRVFSLAARYVYEDRFGGEMDWTKADRGGDERYGESILTNRWELLGTYQLPTREPLMFQYSVNGHHQDSYYGTVAYAARQYVGFGQLTWNKVLGNSHDLLLGAAYRYTWYDDNTPATAAADNPTQTAPSRIALPGIFVQDEITLGPRHTFLLGLRYDYNSRHGSVWSPRLNYKYTSPDKKHTLRLSAGNGYRVANVFTEDHAALTGARTVEFRGDLSPETSWNGNLNYVRKIYAGRGTFIGLDASAFYTYFSNRILPDYETDVNKIIYANLAGHSVSQGLSLNVDVEFANGLQLLAGGTFQDVSLTDEDGTRQRQLLTERFSGVWSIAYRLPRWGLTVDYTGNVYGPMRLPLLGELDDRPGTSPVWSLQNIQLTQRLGERVEVYGGVKNLLNYTPPANSIARAFDPFDRGVTFGPEGQVEPTPENPNALSFDPTYVFAPNQGRRGFLGLRWTLWE
ncbi:TonB-dependent receptor [Neolewinella lacunae]|uniref:TonB-dependent receptor n=1 Tax=Neolewinella lacunae TaxID=1517758 RepID=A0A923PJ10_9BACT|nr:TonB-dependent receptor [Neolewinella lacunae]MBC6992611.1 TonB-dependent receptor [Neolewinella lacunae]MDN3634352.1 TonB-dependent receptor [Neolewinella lacunae]